MPPEDPQKDALDLIRSESVLTLATCDDTGPWSAPVYFVCLGGGFYFFSSYQSRHIQQAIRSGKASASLFCRADSWQAIRGIQMEGRMDRIGDPALSLKVISAYLKRFPFTRDFFPAIRKPDPKTFFDRFKVKLFAFMPTEVYYVDNRYGFGNRQKIAWKTQAP
ncbi:hypothetical protein DSCW_14880 [Desulfosarcina widdelii]|uniref:Pyridoxamine 5'-phosphate oxidase N-terminal domain-containing protein n=1 Tax=Desulfosarcina widdelii TaxID=947919 RepID=A0A5K7Z3E1_9BACT|nr:pyridoxamine 5'-phosphate oxidase family protein [Desulfosarcina widdelii]BBO74071.1 hypothetical protein DSCW_14880 [Desulfosarcina widdelii]